MELKIEWPEGATHFCPAFGRYPTRAYKLDGEQWSYWTGFDWHPQRFAPVQSILRQLVVRRTPEQKERSAHCDRMFGVLLRLPNPGNRSDLVEALYDAGCRLPLTPEGFDARCERVAMHLVGKNTDPSPGVDWICNRDWRVSDVRRLVREALEREQ